MTQTGHPQWFATCVGSRRKQQNLSIDGLRAAGGPTKPVVLSAERGDLKNPRPSTLQKFDTGLRWRAGSAARAFWDGTEPAAIGRGPYQSGTGSVAVGLDPLKKLLAAQRALHTQLSDLKEGRVEACDFSDTLRLLDGAVSAIAGAFVTDTLERNHGQDQKAIDSTIAELLDTPVAWDDPEYEEKAYRRWLFGQPVQVDEATTTRFARRLKGSRSG